MNGVCWFICHFPITEWTIILLNVTCKLHFMLYAAICGPVVAVLDQPVFLKFVYE